MADKFNTICPNCGYEDDFEWIDDGELRCENCGTVYHTDLTYEDIYGDAESFMCDACGNPDYPKCRDSCDRIDD